MGVTGVVSAQRQRLAAEWQRLTGVPWAELRGQGHRAYPLTLASVAVLAVFWLAQATGAGAGLVRKLAGEAATVPLPLAVLRLPLSMFAPAPHLAPWGAVLQVIVVFGLAEATLGSGRTLAVALGATAAATACGRLLYAAGPHGWVGLPREVTGVLDTGPSGGVVALLVYLCLARSAPRLLCVVVGAMVVEAWLQPSLAGYEHLVALAFAVALAPVPWRGQVLAAAPRRMRSGHARPRPAVPGYPRPPATAHERTD